MYAGILADYSRSRDVTARMPRVTFYEGMRLRVDGDTWTVDRLRDAMVGLSTKIGFTSWHRDDLLPYISNGEVAVEPAVGMRIGCEQCGNGVVSFLGDLDLGDFAIDIDWSKGRSTYSRNTFNKLVRSGTWAILPPEEKNAPVEQPISFKIGDRLLANDGSEHVAHQGDAPGTVLLAGPVEWAEWTIADVAGMIASGELAVVEAHTPAVAASATEQDWKRVAEQLSAALKVEQERAATLETKLRRAEASELLYETTFESIIDHMEHGASGAPLETQRAGLKAAGGNPTWAAHYHSRILGAFGAKLEAAEKRAVDAEAKLADVITSGVDALPRLYPTLESLVVCGAAARRTVHRHFDGWYDSGRRVGSFRDALHAAIVAVGDTLPTGEK